MSEATGLDGLIDVPRLQGWVDAHLPDLGAGPLRVVPASTGATNEIFLIDRGEQTLVLRRPSRNPRPESDGLMLREYRVLRALADTDVPHARVHAVCDDRDVVGANFYVMDRIDGFTPQDPLPPPFDRDPEARRGMAHELVDAIAALANVDWRARGLEGFGKPEGFLERQVSRWLGQIDSYEKIEGHTRRGIPGLEDVARWLEDNRPEASPPAIIHGDYQFINTMFHHGAPARMAAIVDWELTTVGDPLLDLAWMLIGWTDPGEPRGARSYISETGGFPTRREMIARYEQRTGRTAENVDYYAVLARFKLAALLEGHFARYQAGIGSSEHGPIMGEIVLQLIAEAAGIAGRA
jgi:aminoglycoside phosphotransferase (APT) family kinase protein